MKTYSFSNINNIFLLGSGRGEFKEAFYELKKMLEVKDEDADKPHPKEIERQARRKARQNAFQEAMAGRRIRWENFRNATVTPTFEPTTLEHVSVDFSKLKKAKKGLSGHTNSIFILCGDYGIGSNKEQYYLNAFESFNKILSYNNSYVIFIRGNHDNPAFFDGKTIDLSNIKAVPDYSIIEASNKRILCIGGAVSIDRLWRKEQEKRINAFPKKSTKTLYWENESPVFDEDAINEIIKAGKINYVVTHTAPSFISPETKSGIDEWLIKDETLSKDISNERLVMDRVFETLRDKSIKPEYWACSHFNYSNIEKRSDVLFRSLNCLESGFNPISIKEDINMFIVLELSNKKKLKSSANKKVSAKMLENDDLFHLNQMEQEEPQNAANEFAFEEGDLHDDHAGEDEFIEEALVAEDNPRNEALPTENAVEAANYDTNQNLENFYRIWRETHNRENVAQQMNGINDYAELLGHTTANITNTVYANNIAYVTNNNNTAHV